MIRGSVKDTTDAIIQLRERRTHDGQRGRARSTSIRTAIPTATSCAFP
jgi:hypothetical protein